MSQPIWTTQHAATLKALRCAARLELLVLAKRHNLSVNQVRQLEDGGDSAFYTPQIKLAVGRKLILALGGEFIEQVPDTDTAPAHALISESPSSASPVATAKHPGEQARVPARANASTDSDPVQPPSPPSAMALWVSSLGLGVALAWGLVWVTQEKESPTAQTAPPESQAPAPPLAPPPPLTPAAAATPVLAAPEVAATAPDASAGTDECRWSRHAPDLTPKSGTRPDNYVHLVARETTTVCWRDANKKARQQTLHAQEQVSFWGTPPFQVYAADPATLKVYFKGQVVRWPESPYTQHIVLGNRPASAD